MDVKGVVVDVSTLVDGTLKLLGALFLRAGQRGADAATTTLAKRAARTIREQLPADHWLAKVLEEAEGEGGREGLPEGLPAELDRLLREQPDLRLALAKLIKEDNSVINIKNLHQYGKVTGVAGTMVVVGPLDSSPAPETDGPRAVSALDSGPEHAGVVQIATIANVGSVEIINLPRPAAPARQLEAVRGFVGRKSAVARLRRLLRYRPGEAPVALVTGPPGVGKTDLAQLVANQLAERDYPALQLVVRLSDGATPKGAEPADVLRKLLLALDVPAGDVPEDLQGRVDKYLSELRGKRALVVIDGATSDRQVLPLLPPPGCATVVTTRNYLGAVRAKGTPEPLSPLSRGEALALLAARLSWVRVARQPYGAIKLAAACDGLPLALSIVAGLLSAPFGRRTRLRHAAHLLRDQAAGAAPGQQALAGAFAVSYQSLPDEERRTFQYLGLLNTPNVETAAVAATAGVDNDEAERRLAILASVNLLQPTARARHWRLRALVLDDARRRADADLTGQARQDAADRAIEFHLRRARSLRAEIDSVARVNPKEAARLQAELDELYARGAALVDRMVHHKLKLAQLVLDELVDVLFDLVTVWPDLRRSREAVRWILRTAAQADAPEIERRETEQRAREWLESQPDPPATDGIASQLLVHAPTRAELRAQFAHHVQVDAASRTIEALDGDQLLRQERSVQVEGWKFQPGEGIQISVDGVPSGGAKADQSGTFTATAWFFSASPEPRVTLYGDLSGRVDPK